MHSCSASKAREDVLAARRGFSWYDLSCCYARRRRSQSCQVRTMNCVVWGHRSKNWLARCRIWTDWKPSWRTRTSSCSGRSRSSTQTTPHWRSSGLSCSSSWTRPRPGSRKKPGSVYYTSSYSRWRFMVRRSHEFTQTSQVACRAT